jgi:hypothetical protein
MDEVLNLHEVFLDTCLKECLLASQDLLRILTKITTTCLLFADQMKRFSGSNEILDPTLRGPSDGLADPGGKSSWLRCVFTVLVGKVLFFKCLNLLFFVGVRV